MSSAVASPPWSRLCWYGSSIGRDPGSIALPRGSCDMARAYGRRRIPALASGGCKGPNCANDRYGSEAAIGECQAVGQDGHWIVVSLCVQTFCAQGGLNFRKCSYMNRVNSNSSRRINVLQEIVKEIYGVRLHIKFSKDVFIGFKIRFHESGQVRHKI